MAFIEALEESFVNVAAARSPSGAPAPSLASAPSSLTQQFFAEGEQLDSAHAASHTGHAAASVNEHEDDEDDGDLAAAVARVPRSRPQMILAALLALGSVAVIAGTVVSLANKPAGGPAIAQISPIAPVARPPAFSAPSARPAGRAREGQRATAVAVGRGSRMRSRPSAPTEAPAINPTRSSSPAAIEVPAPPPPPSAPAGAAPEATDRRAPEVTPPIPSNEGVAPPEDAAKTEPGEAAPTPSEPDESAPAPRAPDDEPPTPSAPESPAPPAPIQGV
jgi:hypothetical protein